MVRSASALLAVLILSGFAAVQQVATHTVVRGDTLWDLAQRYYENPFDWRRIWEANREQVADPNLILPGWVLQIPGREASVTEVVVEAPPAAERVQQPPPPTRTASADAPTIFRQDTSAMSAGVFRSSRADRVAVPRGMVLAAPWVVPLGREPEALGRLEDFAGATESVSNTARSYDRVLLELADGSVRPGMQLQAFREEKVIESVGAVMRPTGIVTVVEVDGSTAIGVVSSELDRMALGDLVRPLPEYALEPGVEPQPVSGGGEAMVMGFAGPNEIQDIGGVAFLDQGADDGVNIGDEYEYLNPGAGTAVVEGRLQVVGVTPEMASARILSMADDVFRQGIVVRLARKMR